MEVVDIFSPSHTSTHTITTRTRVNASDPVGPVLSIPSPPPRAVLCIVLSHVLENHPKPTIYHVRKGAIQTRVGGTTQPPENGRW
jgi:hypothetical protein